MITVRSLHVYPVKSCRGIDVEAAEVVATGFRYDREWMVVDAAGSFLSQRSHPEMATVAVGIGEGCLTLTAAGAPDLRVDLEPTDGNRRRVTVWRDTCQAVSEGPGAARWLSSVLGTPCELVRLPPSSVRSVDRRYAGADDRVAFADGFPLLLIGHASVDELNRRLERPVPADRFRANIVVDGTAAHDEDSWSSIGIGSLAFEVAKPCARCVIVTTDQATGVRSPEPLRTLATYRSEGGTIAFGQNLLHRGTGTVRVGDAVRVLSRR
jgi:uncharacterized protein YcbX